MYWKISIVWLVLLGLGCKGEKQEIALKLSEGGLIETHELNANLGNPSLKIIDVRNSEAYAQGHLPGALQISRKDIESEEDSIPGMRATASMMKRLLEEKGIESGDWLVLYDDRGNPEAARLWCILSGYGKDRIKLLNGGLKAWENDGYRLVTDSKDPMPTVFEWQNTTPATLWIDAEKIVKRINKPGAALVLIDTRTPEEYHGVRQKTNSKRAGHIPGAIHLDWADLIDYHGDHRLKQKEKIRSKLATFGLTSDDSIVLYCHSGVRSSLSTFVLREVLDYKNVWNYDGSWTEWSRLSHYPIEVDSVTTIFN